MPGHWEGDLLSGPNNSYIATLVERHTRYVMLAKVAGKDTRTVVTALIKQAKKLPKELYKSLTWDRGKELTDHRRFTLATLVREVDRYMIDAGSRPIHISELCETFNVGRRTLHRAFIEAVGIPPITFLRRKRLGDVHTALLMGGPDTTVKHVAIEHGFLELGRFAGAYRRLFGELPSQTLRRRIRP